MTNVLALIGSAILMAVIIPTVLLMQAVVDRAPLAALAITLAGVGVALWFVLQYTAAVS